MSHLRKKYALLKKTLWLFYYLQRDIIKTLSWQYLKEVLAQSNKIHCKTFLFPSLLMFIKHIYKHTEKNPQNN